jgi:hypothetical protein
MIKSDEIGVPSTLVAIFANVTTMVGLEVVNVVFTWTISILSIIYLGYKIKNEKAASDKNKNGKG